MGEIDCIVTYLDNRCSFVMWRSKLYDVAVTYTHHYGFHSFPVVDWFCQFMYLWVLTFPLEDCSEFGNCVISLIYRKYRIWDLFCQSRSHMFIIIRFVIVFQYTFRWARKRCHTQCNITISWGQDKIQRRNEETSYEWICIRPYFFSSNFRSWFNRPFVSFMKLLNIWILLNMVMTSRKMKHDLLKKNL